MKRHFLFVSLIVLLLFSASAFGSPLRLDYRVTDLNGIFDYKFDLVLDNNDGKWNQGDGWGWIVFGDSPGQSSALPDFKGNVTDLIVGSKGLFNQFTFTSFGHNGPTLDPVFNSSGLPNLWIPNNIDEKISWSGTSSVNLAQGDLLFSTLEASPGAKKANFQEAMRKGLPGNIAEPATCLLVAVGLFSLAAFGRRKFK